ncbi:bifunctional folylpolyglutamate synthase/dihydrofolate synthase [Spirulina subsalsa FACHB-351]|uniref:tetrahydrofolate synthase n=1 Tax=Spirulina subsalsa FACHB-351 TaxID=234711 RepID=A0ABT3LB06_9CYAN|nr:folylpolyglutamate synthase/dihydrofolate synthase family protein [Spirulina subsalsa]MCW6038170.1 bifunctional folylpolyglutamate synthase/dihydrofolate synthase [Spirulina subsalsa FACHB-351]
MKPVVSIDQLLEPYQRFGVNLGLERMKTLLERLNNPQERVPIVHVAGTNGKGSVCAYLSSILTEAGYRVGRYTSPHLVDWTERVYVEEKPITTEQLTDVLVRVGEVVAGMAETPTLFEVFTAASWLFLAEREVDIGVIEVGLGGRLDATNVCDRPLVTIITSLSREHWQVLGDTLPKIAAEKAGILKAGCQAILGQIPSEARPVIEEKVAALNCPTRWVNPAQKEGEMRAIYHKGGKVLEYELPLAGEVQLWNSAIAIAAIEALQQQGWSISDEAITQGISRTRWPGRLQWITWRGHEFLIDGAHNPASAQALGNYVQTLPQPITWVMGMLSTKEHDKIFEALLHPQDELYLVPVPGHSYANPLELAKLARQICPELLVCETYPDLFPALERALQGRNTVVLCGSLYLLGYFFAKG